MTTPRTRIAKAGPDRSGSAASRAAAGVAAGLALALVGEGLDRRRPRDRDGEDLRVLALAADEQSAGARRGDRLALRLGRQLGARHLVPRAVVDVDRGVGAQHEAAVRQVRAVGDQHRYVGHPDQCVAAPVRGDQPLGRPVEARVGQPLGRDHDAAVGPDEQRFGVVRPVGVGEAVPLRVDGAVGKSRRLPEPEHRDVAAGALVVADVAEEEHRPARAVDPGRKGLRVVGVDPGEGDPRHRLAPPVDGDDLRAAPAVVVGPEHAGVSCRHGQAAGLRDARVLQGQDDVRRRCGGEQQPGHRRDRASRGRQGRRRAVSAGVG